MWKGGGSLNTIEKENRNSKRSRIGYRVGEVVKGAVNKLSKIFLKDDVWEEMVRFRHR